jgi:hypothetical protein
MTGPTSSIINIIGTVTILVRRRIDAIKMEVVVGD